MHLILEDSLAKQEQQESAAPRKSAGGEKPVFYLMSMNNEYKDRHAIAAAATPTLPLQTAEFL